MDDSKLLNLAAKSAGFTIGNEVGEYGWWSSESGWVFGRRNANGTSTSWNPLTDDGDALRLAVKLMLRIEHDIGYLPHNRVGDKVRVIAEHLPFIVKKNCAYSQWQKEFHNNDPFAATRLAIVRAAAEIGKEMK
jgi:hypothetical protein